MPTHQTERSVSEAILTDFECLNGRYCLRFARSVVREGVLTNPQCLQLGAVLQIESTVQVITIAIRVLSEAIVSNHHTLQLTQPLQPQLVQFREAIRSNLQYLQLA